MENEQLIPYGRQWIDEEDISAVSEALRSDFLTTGPLVEQFEQALSDYCGSEYAVAVCNGTAALHVAMMAAGIKPGDRVLTSANTFLASANAAEFVGAVAEFADIDPKTLNVTASTLDAAWRDDVRAVVPVDFAGRSCDMPAIYELARSRGAVVIEDASHAIGSRFEFEGREYTVGGHGWADMTTMSFHPVKTITAAEGGVVLTDDKGLADRCRRFRAHGVQPNGDVWREKEVLDEWLLGTEKGPWFHQMEELGYNYRLSDIHCALGISQLKKLDGFVKRRRGIVDYYNREFAGTVHLSLPEKDERAAWHLYVVRIDFESLGKSRSQVVSEFRSHGVAVQVHYIPVHLQPYYMKKYGYSPGKCPEAEAYYTQCLSLPLYPGMTDSQREKVVNVVKTVLEQ